MSSPTSPKLPSPYTSKDSPCGMYSRVALMQMLWPWNGWGPAWSAADFMTLENSCFVSGQWVSSCQYAKMCLSEGGKLTARWFSQAILGSVGPSCAAQKISSPLYNEPQLRVCAASSLMHQVQARGRKGEGKGKGGCACTAHRRGVTTVGQCSRIHCFA